MSSAKYRAGIEGITARGHRASSLSIHPYFGKVDPAISQTAIRELSHPGTTILDPFCGSGTVLHDALLLGRSAIGWDASPIARLVASAKLLGVSASERQELLNFAAGVSDRGGLFSNWTAQSNIEIPSMPRVKSVGFWFSSFALEELAFIREQIAQSTARLSDEARLLALVAFSRIVTSASNQQSESTYRRIEKEDWSGRVLRLFSQSVKHVLKSATAFNEELQAAGLPEPRGRRLSLTDSTSTITHGRVSARIHARDARNPPANIDAPVSLVVTSPPYLMSWDYGLYHKFRFYWLGFDLDHYEAAEIGRHLRRKKDDVARYSSDMSAVFNAVKACSSQGAYALFVNAPSVVYGKAIDTNSLLVSCAEEAGWKFLVGDASLPIPGPHHGMYASLGTRRAIAPGSAGKREHVLLFQTGS